MKRKHESTSAPANGGTFPATPDGSGGAATAAEQRSMRARAVPTDYEAAYRAVRKDDLMQRKPLIPIAQGSAVHLATGACLSGIAAGMTAGSWLAVPAVVASAIVLAPGWRGLENLTHGAAHHDLGGKAGYGGLSRAGNDAVGNLLFAVPVLQDVAAFRANHLGPHHGGFDSERDPCRIRMESHPDTAIGELPTARTTLGRLTEEVAGFYTIVGGQEVFALRTLVWHFLVYVLPLAIMFGLTTAVVAWLGLFAVLFSLTLPVVRAVAESGEHDYRRAARGLSVAERTFSHHGPINELCHLFGDAHHVEHHLYADVPQYNLRKLRQRLIQAGLDPVLRRRRSLLGKVEPYV